MNKILIVSGPSEGLEQLREILDAGGDEFTIVDHPRETDLFSLDLIIVDEQLPSGDSLALCKGFRQSGFMDQAVPILFFNGQNDVSFQSRAVTAGVDDFLPSPFNLVEAGMRIQNYLELGRVRRTVETAMHDFPSVRPIFDSSAVEDFISNDTFRDIVEGLPGVFYLFDINGKMIHWNSNLCKVTGFTNDEIRKKKASDFFSDEEKIKAAEAIVKVFEEGEQGLEASFLTRDGALIPHMLSGRRVKFNGEDYLVGIGIDVTGQKKIEKRHEENKHTLEVAQRLARFGAWDWNVKTGEVWWSGGIYEIFGLDPATFIPQIDSILKLSPPEQQERGMEIIEKSLEDKSGGTYEQDFYKPDGSLGTYMSNFEPFFNEAGELYRMIGTAVDCTERKKMERDLRHAHKMETIGTLAGGIAHDFNNILFPIIGFTEMSINDLPEDHPVKDNLEDVLKGARRAGELVKQLLAFSRQRDLARGPLRMKPLIEESLKLLRAVIPSNIEIRDSFISGSEYIFGNSGEIHEIIMNLCTNAYHAMEETGGVLNVELFRSEPAPGLNLEEGPYCCLRISDTGTGIDPKILPRIFDPYFTTKKMDKGSGLGLSVIHGIIKTYQGNISVESTPGEGATFKVYLPIASTPRALDHEVEASRPQTGDEHILLVDDESSIVKVIDRMLTRLGYKVTGSTSSIEALKLFKSNPDMFDLVITDMTMPMMVGTELSEKIMGVRSDIPVILCTGFSEIVDADSARAIGIKKYIKKPIQFKELSEKIRSVLDSPDP